MKKKFDIFISYRRSENRQKAEHLYTLLNRRFPCQVSFDKESLAGGRWDEQILNRIDHCRDVIVLITPETFSAAKEADVAKYERWAQMPAGEVLREIEADSNADILRTEISRAIAKGKNIVPVVQTSSGQEFSKWIMPKDIAALPRFQSVIYNDDDPNQLMATLVPQIVRLLKTHSWWMYIIIVLYLLIISIASLMLWYNNHDTSDVSPSELILEEEYSKVCQKYKEYSHKVDSVEADSEKEELAKEALKNCSSAVDKGVFGAYYEMGVIYGDLGNLAREENKKSDYYRQQQKAYEKGSISGSYCCYFGLGNINYTAWVRNKDSDKNKAMSIARQALDNYEKAKNGDGPWKLKEEFKDNLYSKMLSLEKWIDDN